MPCLLLSGVGVIVETLDTIASLCEDSRTGNQEVKNVCVCVCQVARASAW